MFPKLLRICSNMVVSHYQAVNDVVFYALTARMQAVIPVYQAAGHQSSTIVQMGLCFTWVRVPTVLAHPFEDGEIQHTLDF